MVPSSIHEGLPGDLPVTHPPFVARAAELGQLMRLLGAAGARRAPGGRDPGTARHRQDAAGRRGGRARRAPGQPGRASGAAGRTGRPRPSGPGGRSCATWARERASSTNARGPPRGGSRGSSPSSSTCAPRAAPAPYVIVLDDVHLADPASLLLARFLSRERGLRLLLLLTCRDQMPGRQPGGGRAAVGAGPGRGHASRSRACPTTPSRPTSAAFGVSPPEPELLHAVAAVTKGNPLHLRSLTAPERPRDGRRERRPRARDTAPARAPAPSRIAG